MLGRPTDVTAQDVPLERTHVGGAEGEPAQALAFAKRLFLVLAVRDVEIDADALDGIAVFVVDDLTHCGDPTDAAIAQLYAELGDVALLVVGDQIIKFAEEAVPILGDEVLECRLVGAVEFFSAV